MPARQSLGGGRRKATTPKPKGGAIPSDTPTKKLYGAKISARKYGPGPVSVYTAPKARPKVTQKAVGRWNRQAGQRVFKTTTNAKSADVVVKRAKKGAEFNAFGLTGRMGGDSRKGHVVVNRKVVSPKYNSKSQKRELVRVYQHELGHTVGLDHPGPSRNEYLWGYTSGPNPPAAKVRRKRQMQRESGIVGSARRANTNETAAVIAYRNAAKASARIKKRKTPKR